MSDVSKQVRYLNDDGDDRYPPTRGNHTEEKAIERVNKLPKEIQEHVWTNDPCWSYVPAGWRDLVVKLHNSLVQVAPDYRLCQVKEKFGGLRFYTNVRGSPENLVSRIIGYYEELSAKTCDVCGEPGEIKEIQRKDSNFGFVAARCKEHSTIEERTY